MDDDELFDIDPDAAWWEDWDDDELSPVCPETAYYMGRAASFGDECPFEDDGELREEWYRGLNQTDRQEIFGMRRGLAPHDWRDPD